MFIEKICVLNLMNFFVQSSPHIPTSSSKNESIIESNRINQSIEPIESIESIESNQSIESINQSSHNQSQSINHIDDDKTFARCFLNIEYAVGRMNRTKLNRINQI